MSAGQRLRSERVHVVRARAEALPRRSDDARAAGCARCPASTSDQSSSSRGRDIPARTENTLCLLPPSRRTSCTAASECILVDGTRTRRGAPGTHMILRNSPPLICLVVPESGGQPDAARGTISPPKLVSPVRRGRWVSRPGPSEASRMLRSRFFEASKEDAKGAAALTSTLGKTTGTQSRRQTSLTVTIAG